MNNSYQSLTKYQLKYLHQSNKSYANGSLLVNFIRAVDNDLNKSPWGGNACLGALAGFKIHSEIKENSLKEKVSYLIDIFMKGFIKNFQQGNLKYPTSIAYLDLKEINHPIKKSIIYLIKKVNKLTNSYISFLSQERIIIYKKINIGG